MTLAATTGDRPIQAAPRPDALGALRRRLLDPALDAQGVLALTDAVLALQLVSPSASPSGSSGG